MPTTTKTTLLTLAALALSLPIGGCQMAGHRQHGNQMSKDRHVYVSTAYRPLTVTLVDTRDGDEFFSVEVPVGKKLAFQFYQDKAEDAPAATPDLMRWAMYDAEHLSQPLRSSMAAPPSHARMIDVDLRRGVEYPEETSDRWQMPPTAWAEQAEERREKNTKPMSAAAARSGSYYGR